MIVIYWVINNARKLLHALRFSSLRGASFLLRNHFLFHPKIRAPKKDFKHPVAAFDLDTIYQYSDGWDLLNATLVEHERLLWELEYTAKESQVDGDPVIANKLNLVKAQILLFERLLIGVKSDCLVVLSKYYAEILSRPHVGLTERESK